MDPIPFFRPELPPLEDYVEALRPVWKSRMLSNFGPQSDELEALAAGYLGAPHVLAVVSGDIGLMVALRALGLPPGAPCYLPDFTFGSTVNAALWNGLRPVLVDADPDTFCLDPAALAGAVERHGGPGVVLGTHVFGNPCDVDALRVVADGAGLRLAFDAAHAYGTRRDGVPAGRLGEVEVFSLSGTKLVTSAEGGLVATADGELAERIVHLRGYGFHGDYRASHVGINGKISELHAALGVLALARVEQAVARRHELVARYRELLGDAVGWQQVRPVDRSTYKDLCLVLGDRRDAVEASLAEAGVATKRYFRPLHAQPAYEALADGPLPVSERLYATTLCVPVFADLTDDDVERIAAAVLRAL